MKYFRDNALEMVEIGRPVGRYAATLTRPHQLSGADAIHLACAVMGNCSVLFTWDNDLLKIGNLDGLVVTQPQLPAQGRIF